MRIFDSGKKQREFNCLAFAPTGQSLAAGGGYHGTIIWDIATGAEQVRFSTTTRRLQFHPHTNRLLSEASAVQVCDVATRTTAPAVSEDKYSRLPTFAPDADWAVYQRTVEGKRQTLTAVSGYSEPAHTILWEVHIGDTNEESGNVLSLACLPDNERFLSAEQLSTGSYLNIRRRVAIRARADGRVLKSSTKKIMGYGDEMFASPFCDKFVIQDGMWLRVHTLDDLDANPQIVRNDNKKHFTGIAFHPSGKYLAATSNDATVKLFDTTTWEVVRAFTWDIGRMRSIAFSPDGSLAAAGGDKGKVVVWDVDL